MTVETATFISGLNASNPGSSDLKAEGDDHLRLIKSTVLATFPNVTGAVTPTHTQINNVANNANFAVTAAGDLTTAGSTVLGDATTDTLNVGANGLIKDASGNVGIGATPTARLSLMSSGSATGAVTNISQLTGAFRVVGSVAGGCEDGLSFVSGAAGGAAITLARDNSFGTAIKFYTNPTATAVTGATTLAFTIDQGGNVVPAVTNAITLGSSSFRFSSISSVLGNYSGLTTHSVGLNTGNSAQAAATTLDWYEEGTFTPALSGGGIGSPTYTTQTGEFQRIGNKVKFRITLVWTAGTNGGTIGTVTGLPYASTAAIHVSSIMVNLLNASLTFTGVPVAYVNGSTTVQIGAQATAASLASILNPNAGTKDLYIAGEYLV